MEFPDLNISQFVLVALVVLTGLALFALFWSWMLKRSSREQGIAAIEKIDELDTVISAMKNSEKSMKKAMEIAGIEMANLDSDAKFLTGPSNLSNTLGYTEAELQSRLLYDFISEPSVKLLKSKIRDLNENKIASFSIDVELSDRDGIKKYFAFHCSKNSELDLIESFIQDKSTYQEAQIQLSSKDKELSDFLYRSTHDLRGPLSSVLGLANVAKYEIKEEKALYYFHLVIDRVKRLDQILKDLINISSADKKGRSLSVIKFVGLFDEVKRALEHTEGFDRIEFLIKEEHKTDFVHDPMILNTIFQKVIDNAIKNRNTSKSNSHISIGISDYEDGVKVVIQDNGVGMDEELKNKIFDMFYRGTDATDGSGLGLYLVSKALDAIAAKVEMDSNKGVGSTFTFFIPSLLN